MNMLGYTLSFNSILVRLDFETELLEQNPELTPDTEVF